MNHNNIEIEKAAAAQHEEVESNSLTKVDTVHNDEATKVFAAYHGDTHWTDEEEKKLLKRIDWRLIPILCITYGLQYYDKAMIGQAALFGLRTDLKLTGNRYQYASAIFYLGFICGAYPAVALAQRFPIERVASIIVTLWGLCLLLTIVCYDFKTLYTCRFFLGMLESGISPMFMIIVGGFYKKHEQALRMGAWYCCTGYVSIVSPVINYGLGHIKGSLAPWKGMYIFAGSITILWGIALWFILPADPIRAKHLNERQRYIAVARLRTNNSGVRNTHLKGSQIVELLLDIRFWLAFGIAFLCMIANGPVSSFTPIIINTLGFNTLNSLLMVMPVGFYAGTTQIVLPYLAMRYKNIRTWLIAATNIGTTIACILLWRLNIHDTGALMFAVVILPSFGAGYALLMGVTVANTAGYTKRTVSAAGLYIGYCLGNFVGPLIMKATDAPRYPHGFITCVCTSIAAAVLAIIYRYVCVWENNKRDKAGTLEGFDHAYEDDYTDKANPQFRYTL